MDKYKKIWLVTFWMLLWVVWSLYAAWNIITNLTQEVKDGDIISSAYYNNLNWTKADWKACKYSWWKIVCIDDLNWWWTSTTTDITWKDNIFSTNCEYKVLLDNAYYIANRVWNATLNNQGVPTNRLIWSAGGWIECWVPWWWLHGWNQQIWCKNVNSSIWEINKTPSESQSLWFKVYETCNWWWWWWSSSGWGETTPMYKTIFPSPNSTTWLSEAQLQENVDAWNWLVQETINNWIEIHWEWSAFMNDILAPGWWKERCTMSNTTFTIPTPNTDYFNLCSWNICNIWKKLPFASQTTAMCWIWGPTCQRSLWYITCTY